MEGIIRKKVEKEEMAGNERLEGKVESKGKERERQS